MHLTQVLLDITVVIGAASGLPFFRPPPLGLDATRRRVSAVPAFNVTNFAAAAVILSHRNYYSFNVTFSCTEEPVHCFHLGTTLSESLSDVPQTFCGNKSTGVSFRWTRRDTVGDDDNEEDEKNIRAHLVIVRQVDETVIDQAAYAVPINDTRIYGSGQFSHEVYDGPEDFMMKAYRFTMK
ncbi:hypothetical protein B0H63DRAFT_458370 [Podospora didyma]|uniref:Uncharacterized protein n=1 Tax=Podospora didyma TaxID=330526 RepID=A0AAE0U798_9PEZI|nr:hypothetical protein B0H63DRAFT_458370 [Podospora didyma]